LQSNRVWLKTSPLCGLKRLPTRNLTLGCLSGLLAFCSVASQFAHSQEAVTSAGIHLQTGTRAEVESFSRVETMAAARLDAIPETEASETKNPLPETLRQPRAETAPVPHAEKGNWFKRPGESEIIIEGLASYGNYKIFASGYDEKLFTGGIEYDRHTWGSFLKAQVDYVAEFLPFVLLDKPLHVDIWGTPAPLNEKNIRQHVPGIGISPIGFRLQWRNKKAIRPYLEAKGGILVFAKKVPSSEATYENFSLQSAGGVQVRMNERWGLRLGIFSDFHFSDDFIVPVNPGLDVMNANLGLSYHF